MKNCRSILLSLLFACGSAHAAAKTPQYFGVRPGVLAEVKERLAVKDPMLEPAFQNLIKDADKALMVEPPTVTAKPQPPPGGNKHDYMTAAPYFWPDPTQPDGLPYVRKDGKVNPEARTDAYDHQRIGTMAKTVETLALAYHFTGNETYAAHAAKCVRVWFLDPKTRMNPNLNYAQAIHGKNTGRGIGIIEGRNLVDAGNAAGLLVSSGSWKPGDHEDLKAWLGKYLDWLLTSNNGRDAAAERNNHGSFYDSQVMRLALILDRTELARKTAQAAKKKRIAAQIKPDGSQPLELTRTNALGYSQFNLEALFDMASLGERVGIDLWHYETPDGGSLRKALDFLLPYIGTPSKKWPYAQMTPLKPSGSALILRQAATVWQIPEVVMKLSPIDGITRHRMNLLWPPPVAVPGVRASTAPASSKPLPPRSN